MTDLERVQHVAKEFGIDLEVEQFPRYSICTIYTEDDSMSLYFRNADGKFFRRLGYL